MNTICAKFKPVKDHLSTKFLTWTTFFKFTL